MDCGCKALQSLLVQRRLDLLVSSLPLSLVRCVEAVTQDLDLLAEVFARPKHAVKDLASRSVDLVPRDASGRPRLRRAHDAVHSVRSQGHYRWRELPVPLPPPLARIVAALRSRIRQLSVATQQGAIEGDSRRLPERVASLLCCALSDISTGLLVLEEDGALVVLLHALQAPMEALLEDLEVLLLLASRLRGVTAHSTGQL